MTTPFPDTRFRLNESTLRKFTDDFADLVASNAGVRGDLRTAVRADYTDAVSAQRHLIRWMRDELGELPASRVQASLYTTAGLMAHFPKAKTLQERYNRYQQAESKPAQPPRLDLGLALAEAQHTQEARRSGKSSREPNELSPLEKRLQHLCRCDDERFRRYLFSALSYLNSVGAYLPAWWQLADDIRFRADQRNKVALRWQQSFLFAPPWRR